MSRILLLGGIGDALRIARTLGADHIYSIAGLGRTPADLACQVRVGGFGGASGLADYLQSENISLLLDATHPYAAQISANARQASTMAGVPYWALHRPGWQAQSGDDWRSVTDWAELMAAIQPFQRPLFAMGKGVLDHLSDIPAHQFWTVRCLAAHAGAAQARVIAARGPFTLASEQALFEQHGFDVVISKNSGGSATEAKLRVARERGIPVVMLMRPPLPQADRVFNDVPSVVAALAG